MASTIAPEQGLMPARKLDSRSPLFRTQNLRVKSTWRRQTKEKDRHLGQITVFPILSLHLSGGKRYLVLESPTKAMPSEP